MVYLIGNEAPWARKCELIRRSQQSKDEVAECFAKTERKECKNTQKLYCSMGVIYF